MERYCGMALDCTFRGVVAFVAVRGVIAAGELPVARGAAAGAAGSSAPQYSNTVPFPSPLLLLGDAKTLLRKRKLCPKKLCHPRGSPHCPPPPSVFSTTSSDTLYLVSNSGLTLGSDVR